MSEDTNDQPAADAPASNPGVDTASAELGQDQGGESLLDNPDDAPAEAGDEEIEELDLDGKKIPLPKSVKAELEKRMMLQADYTRKTQEAADIKRAADAQVAEARRTIETHQAHLADVASVTALERQLSQYAEAGKPIDWATLRAFDQQNGTAHAQDALILQTQLQTAQQALFAKMHDRQQEQQRESAKLVEQRDAVLSKEIHGWSPETRGKIETLAEKFGFSKDELNTSDARAFKVLHRLMLGEAALSREMKTRSLQAAQATQPATTVRGSAPAAKDPEKLSTDDWMKERRKQLNGSRQRA